MIDNEQVTSRMTEAERFRSFREQLKLSTEDMAKELRRDPKLISRVESGRTQTSRALAIDMVEAFQVNVHWLFTGDGPAFSPYTRNKPPAPRLRQDDCSRLSGAGTSPRRRAPGSAAEVFSYTPSPSPFRGEVTGRAQQTCEDDPRMARPDLMTRPSRRGRISAGLHRYIAGRLTVHRIATWTGDAIGCVCLFVILFGGLWIGTALQ